MSAVGITENAKGDNKKFEVWCNSREEVYIVQVNTQREIKTAAEQILLDDLVMTNDYEGGDLDYKLFFISGTNS